MLQTTLWEIILVPKNVCSSWEATELKWASASKCRSWNSLNLSHIVKNEILSAPTAHCSHSAVIFSSLSCKIPPAPVLPALYITGINRFTLSGSLCLTESPPGCSCSRSGFRSVQCLLIHGRIRRCWASTAGIWPCWEQGWSQPVAVLLLWYIQNFWVFYVGFFFLTVSKALSVPCI